MNNVRIIPNFLSKEQLDEFITNFGINYQDQTGNTILHIFSKTNNELIKYLITKKELDINITNNIGQTALFEAYNEKIVELLLIRRIDYKIRDKDCKLAEDVNEYVDVIINQGCLIKKKNKSFFKRYQELITKN